MTVKEVLKLSAEMLGEKDLVNYFSGKVPDDREYCKSSAELLKRCYDMINDELACEYLPLHYSENIECVNGRIEYSAFSFPPLRILSVKDANGNKCRYKPFIDYLELPDGMKNICYEYRPDKQEENQEALFCKYKAGEYVLSYGIAAEYCLQVGRMQESTMWSNKYYQALRGRLSERKNLTIPARRWY